MRTLRRLWLVVLFDVLPPTIAASIGVWLITRPPPTTIYGIYSLDRTVPADGVLRIRFYGYRNRACPVVSTEELIDSRGVPHRVGARLGNPEGVTGDFDVIVEIPIPSEMPWGLTTFRSVAVYGTDWFSLCFRPVRVGPPQRPTARFCIGECPSWLSERRND
jgi:hypothetical protein